MPAVNRTAPFARPLVLSALLHGSAFAALALIDPRVPPAPEPQVIEVSLGTAPVLPAATAAARPVAAVPPRTPPAQAALAPAAALTPRVPEPESIPQAVAAPVPEPEATAGPAAQAAPEPAAAPAPAPAPTAEPAAPAPAATVASVPGNAERPANVDALPYVLYGPVPPYPAAAREAGRQGKVRVRVLISERGEVLDTRVATGSGFASLDEAALAGLRHWRFQPARRDGRAVAAWVVVPVLYNLH